MGMNSMPQLESMDTLKRNILDRYESEGPSEQLELSVQEWVDRKRSEGEKVGGSVEERVRIEMDIIDFYLSLDRNVEDVIDALYDLIENARNQGLEDLAEEIRTKIRELL